MNAARDTARHLRDLRALYGPPDPPKRQSPRLAGSGANDDSGGSNRSTHKAEVQYLAQGLRPLRAVLLELPGISPGLRRKLSNKNWPTKEDIAEAERCLLSGRWPSQQDLEFPYGH